MKKRKTPGKQPGDDSVTLEDEKINKILKQIYKMYV